MTVDTMVIVDWASNIMFEGQEFSDFDEAERFLSNYFDQNNMSYDDERGEYTITPLSEVIE